MTALSMTLEADEVQSLQALAEVDAASGEAVADLTATAQALLRKAIETRLQALDLPWAPPPEAVARRVREAARPAGRLAMLARSDRRRRYAVSVLAVAALVVLWGGYGLRWQWTGFPGNEQVWDWMRLLLLPVVVGTSPLWLRHSDYGRPARRGLYVAAAAAFGGFVAAGYLVPLAWTGFSGNTLWDWFELLLLPAAVASAKVLPSVLRRLRAPHHWAISVGLLAWSLTVVGGYAWHWAWTGYQGNTLWDWLQLLLLPFVVPVFLLPAAVTWMSGNVPASAAQPRARAGAR